MIFSISRRTDIPYFYADWFLDKLQKKEIGIFNTYNNKTYTYPLTNEDILVFWTKDVFNFQKSINFMVENDYKFYFQYTLNHYPTIIEKNVRPLNDRIKSFKELSEKIGKDKVIWRYDPIIVSNITDVEYHKTTFKDILEKLKNHTSKVIISILDNYSKITENLKNLEKESAMIVEDIVNDRKKLSELMYFIKNECEIAGLELESCSENNLSEFGIKNGACVDGNLMTKLFGKEIKHIKDVSQRKECGCMKSLDVGIYNSCLFNCVYCYANSNNEKRRIETFKQQKTELIYLK